MIARDVEKNIKNWIEKDRNALLVSGARQVGKTYSIRRCLREAGVDFLEVNLIETPQLVEVFDKCQNIRDLEINLSATTGYSLKKGVSYIFIDEVQQCKDIVTKIKFWVDDGSYRFILSGSLLGVELNELRSAPVGYLTEVQMYPVDFKEFLLASGVSEDVLAYLHECFDKREPVFETTHNILIEHFRRYLAVGGLPRAVDEYVSTGDMNVVLDVQQDVIRLYGRDFTKYESLDKKLMLKSIYDSIPSQLLKQNRRFNYADIKKGLRFERVENSFLWLDAAGVTLSAFNATEPRISLYQNKKSSLVKLYLSDVGLLTRKYGRDFKNGLLIDKKGLNCGGVYENAVIEELIAHGVDVYYYNNNRIGELDFVIEYKGNILPIEVKSGKDYYVHSAVDNVLNNHEYEIKEAFVFTNYNVSVKDRVVYLPIYMCMFLGDNEVMSVLEPLPELKLP